MRNFFLILILVLLILSGIAFFLNRNNPNTSIFQASKTTLDLSNTGLEKVPDYVLKETNLETLNLSDNNLTGSIPGEIRFLTKLKTLDLSNNKMTGVPAEVGQLTYLENLDLSDNQLTGLPNELANLKNLKIFNISGNNYSQHDLDVILEGLPSTVEVIK